MGDCRRCPLWDGGAGLLGEGTVVVTTMRRGRGLFATTLAVLVCAGAAVPAGAEQRAEAVPTVFFGDSYTANYGIALKQEPSDITELLCFRAEQNFPKVTTRELAEKGNLLDITDDRSCGGAVINNFWNDQTLYPTQETAKPQQEALKADTRLVVGSLGGNTVGFVNILKQCSQRLRDEAGLLPGTPVDSDQSAEQCAAFFTEGDGKQWLDYRFEQADYELEELLDRIAYFSPDATAVLVGYPRIVPADAGKCRIPAPGQTTTPLADIPADALPVFDKVQERLNDLMRTKATEFDATFVDLYAVTGDNTACDGADRAIGGLFEDSQVTFGEQALPWYLHPNAQGRDLQASHVATAIQTALSA